MRSPPSALDAATFLRLMIGLPDVGQQGASGLVRPLPSGELTEQPPHVPELVGPVQPRRQEQAPELRRTLDFRIRTVEQPQRGLSMNSGGQRSS